MKLATAKPSRAMSSGAALIFNEAMLSSDVAATVTFAMNPFSSCCSSFTAMSCHSGIRVFPIACSAPVFITACLTASAITGAVFHISSPSTITPSAFSMSLSVAAGMIPDERISTILFSSINSSLLIPQKKFSLPVSCESAKLLSIDALAEPIPITVWLLIMLSR